MFRRMALAAALAATVGAAPIFAQSREPKAEVSAFAGWSFSDGVSGNSVTVPGGGGTYNRIDPKDSGMFGFTVGFLVNPEVEVGFRYSYQPSQLVAGGPSPDATLGDLSVSTYHGYFAYNFAHDTMIVPFVFGGLGATSFGSVNASLGANSRSIPGSTKFSTVWGGGVKILPNPRVGVRVSAEWVPTYIKSDASGWWCDPFWGCYVVGNAQYSNQFEFAGGVVFRF